MKHASRFHFVLPVLLIAAFVVGCGSSSSSSSSNNSSGGASASSTSTSATAPSAAKPIKVTTKHSKLGTILAAGNKGLTVYLFEADKGTTSVCTGQCAKFWPPVIGAAQPSGTAMSADLGTTTRSNGQRQVTYKGHPLYFFVKDKDHGDAYGQGSKAFGAGWYVLNPSGHKIDKS